VRDLTTRNAFPDRIVDIQLEPNGDIKVLPNGDIALDNGIDAIEQAIRWRILTELGSWPLAPECGSDLRRFGGQPNLPEVADALQAEIYRALGHDGYLMEDEVDIYVAPISSSRLVVIIQVKESLVSEAGAFQFEFDLITGELSGWQRIA